MNHKTKKLLSEIISVLNDRYDYAVLRNYDYLPENNLSRDVDILLNPRQLSKFQKECINLAEINEHKIIYTYWDTQFWTIVFGNTDQISGGILQLDILVNLNVLGTIFLEWNEVLSDKIFNGKLYHLSPRDTFLCKFIYCLALGKGYPEKYSDIMDNAIKHDRENVDKKLMYLLNDNTANLEYWLKANQKEILLKGFISSLLRNPWLQIKAICIFIWQYSLNIYMQRGLFITLSGPDGSGKTTLLTKISKYFSEVNPPIIFHFRPQMIPNLGEAAHRYKLKKDVDKRYEIPHRSKKNGVIESNIRLIYYLIDFIVGYYFKILPLRWKKNIIIFDRYIADLISDSERLSIFLDCKYLNLVNKFVPQADYNFLIRVNPYDIRNRKQELEVKDIERIYQNLEFISMNKNNYIWIDNSFNPESAALQILEKIFDRQHILNKSKIERSET